MCNVKLVQIFYQVDIFSHINAACKRGFDKISLEIAHNTNRYVRPGGDNATDTTEEWRRSRKVRKQAMASQKIRGDSCAWADNDAELLLTIMLKTLKKKKCMHALRCDITAFGKCSTARLQRCTDNLSVCQNIQKGLHLSDRVYKMCICAQTSNQINS